MKNKYFAMLQVKALENDIPAANHKGKSST